MRGRPPKEIKFDRTVNVRFTKLQYQEIVRLAQKLDLEVSVFIRKVIKNCVRCNKFRIKFCKMIELDID